MSDGSGDDKLNLRVDRLAAAMDAARARARGETPPAKQTGPRVRVSPDDRGSTVPAQPEDTPSAPYDVPEHGVVRADRANEASDHDMTVEPDAPVPEERVADLDTGPKREWEPILSEEQLTEDAPAGPGPILEDPQDADVAHKPDTDFDGDQPPFEDPELGGPVADATAPDDARIVSPDPADPPRDIRDPASQFETLVLTEVAQPVGNDASKPLLLTEENKVPAQAKPEPDFAAHAKTDVELEKVMLAAAAPTVPEPSAAYQGRGATWQRPVGPALLSLDGVQTNIGRYHILSDVGFDVPSGAVTMLLGRNGVGKTTTLRTIMGLWHARAGSIRFAGEKIEHWPPHRIARAGIGYVPESMSIFSDLTVAENVTLGAVSGPVSQQRLDWLFSLFPQLATFWRVPAGHLSGGQKQMLALSRALVEKRRLYLIDEPTKGLAPSVVSTVVSAIRDLKLQGATILMVEQNFAVARALGDQCVVMDDGRVTWRGQMSDLADDPELQTRLMGLTGDAA
ncbi:ABC transporter ATP-binding protein [Meridianimarinicoccus aquatilis]